MKVAQVPKEPTALPKPFEWCTLDLTNDEDAHQVYEFLSHNYVEDDDGVFRFDYPVEFLRWTLLTPNYNKEWHVGVRAAGQTKLMGFVTGTAIKNNVSGQVTKMVEINFLCVHKKLRDKRLGPVLIKEVTRRVNLQNIWSAYYTSGSMFPHPFTTAQYFHRTLNAEKNVKTGFS